MIMKFSVALVLGLSINQTSRADVAAQSEISQSCIAVGCFPGDDPGYPVTLAQPGNYLLTTDLEPPDNRLLNTIEIRRSQVDLDLGGFTIEGGGRRAGGRNGVQIMARARNGIFVADQATGAPQLLVRVHNGVIRGFEGAGIQAPDPAWGSTFEALTVSDCGVGIEINAQGINYGVAVLVRASELNRNLIGIEAGAANPTIRSNSFDYNAVGINAYWGDVVSDNIFLTAPQGSTDIVGLHCEACGFWGNEFQIDSVANRPYELIQGLDLGHNTCPGEPGGRCP